MSDRQTAADYEREAQRLAANAQDGSLYGGATARDRNAVLSGTYATLALMATIREGRETVTEEEPMPEKEPIRVVTPNGSITLFPIPPGGSDAPMEACMLRAPHLTHIWLRGNAQGGTLALQCPGREHVTDVHGLLPKQCPRIDAHPEHTWLVESGTGFTYRCLGVGTEER